MAGDLPDERSRRYARVEALMAAQDWDQAIAQCIALLAADPEDERVVTLLARCQQALRTRRQPEAQAAPPPTADQGAPQRPPSGEVARQTTRVLPTTPGPVESQALASQARLAGLLAEAGAAMDAGHHDQALDLAQRVLAGEPDHEEARRIHERAQAAIAARDAPGKVEPGTAEPGKGGQEPARERPGPDRTVLLSRPGRLSEGGLRARTLGREPADQGEQDAAHKKAEMAQRLYAQAQHAMDRREYADAVVNLEAALAIDAGHHEAQALLRRAQQERQKLDERTPRAAPTGGGIQELRDKAYARPSAGNRGQQMPVWVLLLVVAIVILHIIGAAILFTR